ncbi:MAG: TetR/AcrR family transcriptional regulator [Sphingomonadales bacterium]|nr:TetR/AcrR family transcriptional regulator [Sphingomonadales bacterium]
MSLAPNHITTIRDLFFRYGLKSMTMDELARQLGCSKKTIYEQYPDKKILVHAVLGGFLNEHRSEMAALDQKANNAIEKLISMAAIGFQKMKNLTPTILFDLQKTYPELWMELERYRQEEIVGIFKRLIKRGQQEGLFRQEIDPAIVSIMHLQHTNLLLDPIVFGDLNRPLATIFHNIIEVFVCGIATPKGLQLWNTAKVQMKLRF